MPWPPVTWSTCGPPLARVADVSEVGRHRVVRPEDFAALRPDDLEARLLGKPATMARRDVSRGAEVSLLSARKFWHALGFPNVEDDDAMFTEADQMALMAVARLVREQELDETTALAMTRAFARTTDRLAVWQTQLMAEALADPETGGRARRGRRPRRARPRRRGGRRPQAHRHGRRARAAPHLRLAAPPHRRDLAHARRRRPAAVRRRACAGSSGSPTWSTSPRWCGG